MLTNSDLILKRINKVYVDMLLRDFHYLEQRGFERKLTDVVTWCRGEFSLNFENRSRILLKDESGLTVKIFTKTKHAYKFIRKIERASVSNLKF